jgi:DNA-binding response OmpR family regulator
MFSSIGEQNCLTMKKPMKIFFIGSDSVIPDFLSASLDSREFVLETINIAPEWTSGIRKADPDLFVVDDHNSGMDVASICQNIRQYSMMPILVLAPNHKSGMVEHVLDAGADEYLIKPVSGNILAAHLKTLARRARAEKISALSLVKDDRDKNGFIGLLSQ